MPFGGMPLGDESASGMHGRTFVTDAVLRCIGRDVVVFQQIEYRNKHSTKGANVARTADRIAIEKKSAETVSRMTMGPLAGELLDNVLGIPDEYAPCPNGPSVDPGL